MKGSPENKTTVISKNYMENENTSMGVSRVFFGGFCFVFCCCFFQEI